MHMSGHVWRGKKVLVTGGAGFIGSHLVDALVNEGARITVLDNLQAGRWTNIDTSSENVRLVEGDVREAEGVNNIVRETQPEFVFHLAANASVPGSVDDPCYDFESNCGGTFVLLNAIRLAGIRSRTVVASSGAVYGEPEEFPIRENSSLAPISPYGASKLAAEIEARMFSDVYEMQISMARIFNSYGPRMPRFVVFDFLKKLQSGPDHLEILGNGKQVRDLNYVADTVTGLMVLATDGGSGEAYNVASGDSHDVTEIAHMLLDTLGLRDRTRISYTGKSWSGDAQRWEVDIEKIQSLEYTPVVPLKEGLEQVITWYQQTFGNIL
jgi:UDP-glucose 4-epimerase